MSEGPSLRTVAKNGHGFAPATLVEKDTDDVAIGIGQILSFKDDQGEPMSLSPAGLVCVVHPMLLYTALETVGATMIGQTSNVLAGIARVIAMPGLSAQNAWYLLKTDGVVRPFIFQDREPVEFGALAEESEEGFKREKLLFGVRARYRLTYGYWQHAVRVSFE